MRTWSWMVAGVVLGASVASHAQGFPDGASSLPATELAQRFSGKTFNVKLADGGTWHVEYKADGSFSLAMNNGFKDTGDWRTEDGKICSKGRKIGSSCNDVRINSDNIFLKRDSGEIVQFVPQ
jgi:hypothetical protein